MKKNVRTVTSILLPPFSIVFSLLQLLIITSHLLQLFPNWTTCNVIVSYTILFSPLQMILFAGVDLTTPSK